MNEIAQLKQEISELKNSIVELQTFNEQLKRANSIPLSIEQSFRARFISNILTLSTKSVATESQTVSEAGASSYSVAKPMDGFKIYNDAGTPIYIPYYL